MNAERDYDLHVENSHHTLIGAEHQEHGAMFFRTLACLPALTGAWRHRGGGLARSVGAWAETNVDESVFDGASQGPAGARRAVNMNHLGRALTDPTMDPRVMALFVWNGNPLVSVPNAELTRRGLERDDLFTVASEQFLTDTARYADVVFPATTQIEQTDVVASWGHLYLGWNEAADLIEQSMERTIEQKKVTYDFERLMPGATKVKTSEFAGYMIENMGAGVLV